MGRSATTGHRLADDDAPAHPSSRFRHHAHRHHVGRGGARSRRALAAASAHFTSDYYRQPVLREEDAQPRLRFSDEGLGYDEAAGSSSDESDDDDAGVGDDGYYAFDEATGAFFDAGPADEFSETTPLRGRPPT